MRLRLLPEAVERIDQARTWWHANREKAPNLFDEELVDTLEQIVASPTAGQRVVVSGRPSVYRRLMSKTPFHVYYEVVEGEVFARTDIATAGSRQYWCCRGFVP